MPDEKTKQAIDTLQQLVRERAHMKAQSAVPAELPQLGCGVREVDGQAFVCIFSGDIVVRMTPDEADQLATDVRQFAIEVRNGGRLT